MAKRGTTWSFAYDVNGMRTSRSNGSTTYTYVYNGGQLSQMTVGTITLYFTYDASGRPATVKLGNTTYYYVTNLQGDVVAIVNGAGTQVVSYTYDAWGRPLTTSGTMALSLGAYNPLRYRGYVYDQDTGLYYLQSRYYNPQIGRFLNADALVSTGQGILGNNMFAYCGNNPVNFSDSSGYYTNGQIHDFVIEDIVENERKKARELKYKRWDTLIIYDHAWRGKWFGFCDLYDPITGEMWEVKKQSVSYTCTTNYATDQLDNYISNGYLVVFPNMESRIPGAALPSGRFTKTDSMNNEYVISYWYAGNGIIRYSYYIKLSKQTHMAVAVAVTAMASGAACGKLSLTKYENAPDFWQ